jgi:hypothetical protein
MVAPLMGVGRHGSIFLASTSGQMAYVLWGNALANDEHGVALTTARAERGDKTWSDNAVLVFHIRDGKVSEFWLNPAICTRATSSSPDPLGRQSPGRMCDDAGLRAVLKTLDPNARDDLRRVPDP